MKIGNISSYINNYKKNDRLKNNFNKTYVAFQGTKENAKKAALIGSAALMTLPLASCNNNQAQINNVDSNALNSHEQTQVQTQTPDDIINQTDALMDSGLIDKTLLADVSLISVPVSEFYFTNSNGEVILHPNENLPRNEEGSIIVTITENASENLTGGNTLNEIISKVYSDDLASYDEDEQSAIKNKIIDEIIQSNPSLAAYIKVEMGDKARSYEKISGLDLYKGTTSSDQLLDTRLLTMPTSIVYQVQGEEPENVTFITSSSLYTPSSNSASVIKDGGDLLDDEFSSFSDMIYGMYGKDISDEAYRDIVYAVVNSPENAAEFEYILDEMNFNDIIETANINDLNRTLDENTDKELLGISLPSVTTLRTTAKNADVKSGNRDGIVYQISPSAVVDGQNDLSISIVDNTDKDGLMKEGQVFKLADVLQFYNSPDGNGRFALVVDGKLVLNDNVNYVDEFATQILQQVVYANLDIFATKYEDQNGIHNYGVFDVDKDYDTEGKTLDEILQHSTINIDRLMKYSFVDENGISRFEEGVKLNLPQFNYRINECAILRPCCNPQPNKPNPSVPDNPSIPDEEPSVPDDEPSIPDDEPSIPDDEPSIPDDNPTDPTDNTDPTDPTDNTDPTDPTSCPTIPTEEPTKETEPTLPTGPTDPTSPTGPTGPTDPTIRPTEGGSEVDPIDPSDPTDPTGNTDPTDPTGNTDPTDPTGNTDPTDPTGNTDPTDPTGNTDPTDPTNQTCPTEPTEDPSQETEPTLPSSPTEPSSPSNPTEPSDPTSPTGPTEPSGPTSPTGPTDPTCSENPTEAPQPEDEPSLLSSTNINNESDSIMSVNTSNNTKTTMASKLTSYLLSKLSGSTKDKLDSIDTYV